MYIVIIMEQYTTYPTNIFHPKNPYKMHATRSQRQRKFRQIPDKGSARNWRNWRSCFVTNFIGQISYSNITKIHCCRQERTRNVFTSSRNITASVVTLPTIINEHVRETFIFAYRSLVFWTTF